MYYRIQGDFEGKEDFETDTPVLVGDFIQTERGNLRGRVIGRKFLVDKHKVEFIFLTIDNNSKE